MIPETLSPDTESAAERRFYKRLRDDTPDELVVFHHVGWLVPGYKGRPQRERPTSSSPIPSEARSSSR